VTHRQADIFPFSAVVGQETLKLALTLVAVDPAIGGVLVSGHKGTAKSTAVRALARSLPTLAVVEGCRFGCDPDWPDLLCDECRARAAASDLPRTERRPELVELPVSATEDRVLGTLDFEHAIKAGERRFEPGLLARANRNVLYVDEVNLLDDHLVDSLLDVAASGVNTVEREGVTISHPSRFVLVGTMNPEEGDVRPQLLDRFGLYVTVQGLDSPRERVEVVRRRNAYEADPSGFCERWRAEERALAESIVTARARLGSVALADDLLYLIASICAELGVEGHRADITIARAAVALAALEGRAQATADDVRTVAPLAVAHRIRRGPWDPETSAEALARTLAEAAPASGEGSSGSGEGSGLGGSQSFAGDGIAHVAHEVDERLEFPATSAQEVLPPTGGHERVWGLLDRGRYVASSRATPLNASDVALDATIRAAAARGQGQAGGPGGPAVSIGHDDLRSKVRSRRAGACVLFCVDASGSMGVSTRMETAKAAVMDLLVDAYKRRDRVGLVTFRGDRAQLVLSPTGSIELARLRLADLRTGGATPLAHGLSTALEVLGRESRRDENLVPWLVLVTDGRGNVGLGGAPDEDTRMMASRLREAGIRSLVMDSGSDTARGSVARELADLAGGTYLRLGEQDGGRVAGLVRDRLGSR
jgi:magnesium chelatase subunit D